MGFAQLFSTEKILELEFGMVKNDELSTKLWTLRISSIVHPEWDPHVHWRVTNEHTQSSLQNGAHGRS